MPRAMTTAMQTAIAANELLPAIFFSATFATGPIYVWSGYGSITWGGHTWSGIGTLGAVSVIDEASTIEPKNVTVSMSGIDATLLADVLNEFSLGSPAQIYFGLFAGTPPALIADPITAWSGRMDQPTIDVDANMATISIACENRLIDLNGSGGQRRLTNDDQTTINADDTGLSFAAACAEVTIYFGASPNISTNL
jgi:hypothetical protein